MIEWFILGLVTTPLVLAVVTPFIRDSYRWRIEAESRYGTYKRIDRVWEDRNLKQEQADALAQRYL